MTVRHGPAASRLRGSWSGMLTCMVVALLPACAEAPRPTRSILIEGEIRVPPGASGAVTVSLYHAWALQGELRHPLQAIGQFEAAPGAFTHRFDYPETEGEGLVVWAWIDLDGDGVLCTPERRVDLAGLAEVHDFPADRVSVTLDLAEPCRGPDWFYPRGAGGTEEQH
jgi:hypothetical protein